jgi:L-aminopeptidase/D-esterase-like protein
MHLVEKVHAVVLAGGSAFGLEAATGVVDYLEGQGVGFDVGVAKVPIVPAAILFDLGIGDPQVRPDAAMGRAACEAASQDPPQEGNAGAGMGATAGKILGMEGATKAGIGTWSVTLKGGLVVGALVAVNPFGDVVDPWTGRILAGARTTSAWPEAAPGQAPFADTLEVMRALAGRSPLAFRRRNTVIGVVATNARLSKEGANKVAQMAQDGVARAVRPAHTMLDGDTLFALSAGELEADVNIIGAFAAQAVAVAIVRAVMAAREAGGVPAAADLPPLADALSSLEARIGS